MPEAISSMLEDFYDAWRAQDLDWLATYLPSDFRHTMHIPHAIYADGGALEGKTHVMERWRRYVPQCEFLRYDFSALLVGKDIAAAEISFVYRHRETGVTLETTKAESLGVRGGLADTDDRVLQPHRRRGIDSESPAFAAARGRWPERKFLPRGISSPSPQRTPGHF